MITIVVKIKTTTNNGTGVVKITIKVRNKAGTAKSICHIVEIIRIALYLKIPNIKAGKNMQTENPNAIPISLGRSKFIALPPVGLLYAMVIIAKVIKITANNSVVTRYFINLTPQCLIKLHIL